MACSSGRFDQEPVGEQPGGGRLPVPVAAGLQQADLQQLARVVPLVDSLADVQTLRSTATG